MIAAASSSEVRPFVRRPEMPAVISTIPMIVARSTGGDSPTSAAYASTAAIDSAAA